MSKQQIGVVGMAVMGSNLALNIESRGFSVAVFNRSPQRTKDVLSNNPDKNLKGTFSVEEFVDSLEKPRKIILMVKAGAATDATIDSLLPHLDEGDILIDGGNTYFEDTIARNKRLANSGINFIGMGVSGGEEGALLGPAIMPGGQKEAYDLVAPILEQIAAKADDGTPCVTYIGEDGAGHYVKMAHNGIEYGDMQLIAESYQILRDILGYEVSEIAEVFSKWNEGKLNSYLIEITADILKAVDPDTGKPMVDVIKDAAGNKGTGKWMSQDALDLGEPLTLITEAVHARYISAKKDERVKASKILPEYKPNLSFSDEERTRLVDQLEDALYFSKIMSYAQGFAQMKTASEEYNWDLNFKEIASIFRAGCIIRAGFLQNIMDAFEKDPNLDNLLLDDYFLDVVKNSHLAVREIIKLATDAGVPTPTFSAALNYYDSYRSAVLPANIIQAQRDYFGAHTYERVDREGTYHFRWIDGQNEIKLD